jgi:hypothetical protein
MHVRIDQSGNDCPSAKIDNACLRSSETLNFLVGAYGANLLASDGDRFSHLPTWLLGKDVSSTQNEICLAGDRPGGRKRNDENG